MSSIAYLRRLWDSDRGIFMLELAKHKTKNLKSLSVDNIDFKMAFLQIGQYVLNYCNRMIIPEELDTQLVLMLVDAMKNDYYTTLEDTGYDAANDVSKNIASISEGDTSISFSSSATGSDSSTSLDSHNADLDSWLCNYNNILNNYRQLFKL
jgi:hypothetical protein